MSKEQKSKGLMPLVMEITADNTQITFVSPLTSEKKAVKKAKKILKTQGASAVSVGEVEGETPHLVFQANWTYDETTSRPLVPDIIISDN